MTQSNTSALGHLALNCHPGLLLKRRRTFLLASRDKVLNQKTFSGYWEIYPEISKYPNTTRQVHHCVYLVNSPNQLARANIKQQLLDVYPSAKVRNRRDKAKCPLCKTGEIEDIPHFIPSCLTLNNDRSSYFTKIDRLFGRFRSYLTSLSRKNHPK